MGHGNSGKTSLAESMLFTTGAIDRMGKVTDGNTVCDYDAEEIKRQITITFRRSRKLRRPQGSMFSTARVA